MNALKVYGIREEQAQALRSIAQERLGSSSISALARSLLIREIEQHTSPLSESSKTTTTKKRLELRLPLCDYQYLQNAAQIAGMTPSLLLNHAIRSYRIKHPFLSVSEHTALYQSNYQLLRIGRNLNQIARQLNTMESVNFSTRHVESLLQIIDEHTEKVGVLMRNNRDNFEF